MKRYIAFFILVICLFNYTLSFAKEDISITEKKAEVLSCLNILKGDENGFRLNDKSNRLEAIVILIRLSGNEKDALLKNMHHPFVDVPDWASPYVGYAYALGLTNGVDKSHFGTNDLLSANHFVTFVLRNLGYLDKEGDFRVDDAVSFAYENHIITAEIDVENFERKDITSILYDALGAKIKNTNTTFDKKLKALGVFSDEEEKEAVKIIADVLTQKEPS